MADLEHVTRLADALSPPEKQRLIEHLSRQLQDSAARGTGAIEPAKAPGRVWQSKFAGRVHEIARSEPSAEAAESRPRVAGLNAGEVWMSDDFDAELPDEFWFSDE